MISLFLCHAVVAMLGLIAEDSDHTDGDKTIFGGSVMLITECSWFRCLIPAIRRFAVVRMRSEQTWRQKGMVGSVCLSRLAYRCMA
ncbi:hypothetical protein [Brenneria roseae]|uniref:hypothetical protein n=1 Tax=Brenneria roseae TaxID=1509241 RepID=UPI0011B1E8B9|nr:hypothetical protein [Brenneria roseae]